MFRYQLQQTRQQSDPQLYRVRIETSPLEGGEDTSAEVAVFRRASSSGMIVYQPGDSDFSLTEVVRTRSQKGEKHWGQSPILSS